MIICMMLGSFAAPGCGGLVGTEPFGAWERNLTRATASTQGYSNPASKNGPFYVANWSRKHLNLIATNLLADLRSGKMTVADYRRAVGTRTELPILPLIDIHLYWAGAGNTFSMVADSVNSHIQAYKAVDFSFGFGASTRFTGNYYQDYILPSVDPVFEDSALTSSNYAGFNELNMRRGPFKPPGECKQDAWFYMELYKKLGFNPNDYSNTYRDATYYEDTEARNKASYELRAKDALEKRQQQWPTWDQFRNDPNHAYINIDEFYKDTDHGGNWADKIMWEEPSAAIGGTVVGGTTEHYSAPKVGKPIATKSGKLEPSSWLLKDKTKLTEAEHFDLAGNAIDFLQSDWGYYTDFPKYGTWPIPVYQPLPYGLEDNTLVKTQPLAFASSHSRYRHHSHMGDHPYGAGETYRHACWISVADAKARGIVDGDLVRVYNPKGETMVPAYVTNKISPGHVVVRIGMWYKPNAAGVDRGGDAQMVLGQDITTICKTPAFVTATVQVEKV